MRFRVTVRKLNVTDGQTDGWRRNISRPGPSARDNKFAVRIAKTIFLPSSEQYKT